ncbi:MAG: transketolase [Fibrobacterales bacterium]
MINMDNVKSVGDYVRYLSAMAIQKAKSGHPGLPLGCADIGVLLYSNFIQASARNPEWMNRDRFILSAGHGSMLVYALNYIFGYQFSIKDIVNFRQLGSNTPGHPEYELHKGIETTTGPLGQGFANAVGLAVESKMMAARFNTEDSELFNYNTYVLMGDGCTMEGMTNEAASIAGSLKLDNLIAIYDDNEVTIDESSNDLFTEDVQARYEALGWEVAHCVGTDLADMSAKLSALKASKGKPKLLIVETKIGEGLNELRGSHSAHGAPVGPKEVSYILSNSTMKDVADCKTPDEALAIVEKQLADGSFYEKDLFNDAIAPALEARDAALAEWETLYNNYKKQYPEKYAELQTYKESGLTDTLRTELLNYSTKVDATRGVASGALQLCAAASPKLIGGAADLVGSTKATVKGADFITSRSFAGRNIAFGVREAAMGGVANGLALSRDFIPFTSTFFTFIDYMKPAVRLAAIMQLKHLFIFTHDSIYVGEDGPTHEPIEHLGATRLIPGIYTYRPCNDMETGFSFLEFMENDGPAVILGTRQVLDTKLFGLELDREATYTAFKKGGYTLFDCDGTPDIVLAGSGSEITTLIGAKEILESQGKKVRLVSIPCMEKLQEQSTEYIQSILGAGETPVYLMEAASHRAFKMFYADHITVKGIDSFGVSGNYKDVAKHFGFVPEAAAAECSKIITQFSK